MQQREQARQMEIFRRQQAEKMAQQKIQDELERVSQQRERQRAQALAARQMKIQLQASRETTESTRLAARHHVRPQMVSKSASDWRRNQPSAPNTRPWGAQGTSSSNVSNWRTRH